MSQKPYVVIDDEESLSTLPEKWAEDIRRGKMRWISKRPEATAEEMIKAVNEDFA